MAEDPLPFEALDEVGQAVGFRIKVRIVYLVGVSGEDDFAVFPCPAYDGLDLMRSQVLSLIYEDELGGNTPSTDKGQGFQFDDIRCQEITPVLFPRWLASTTKSRLSKMGSIQFSSLFSLLPGR